MGDSSYLIPPHTRARTHGRTNNYKIPLRNSNSDLAQPEREAECKNIMQNLYNIWVNVRKIICRCAVVRNLYEEVCCKFSHSLFSGQSCKKFV